MKQGDKIPDPRDRPPAPDADAVLSDAHPGSLAAFEDWCRITGRRHVLNVIGLYRRDIEQHTETAG